MASVPVIDCLFSPESQGKLALPRCATPDPALLRAMDRAGVMHLLLAPCRHWQCERHWICGEIQIDEIVQYTASAPMHFSGLAGYNPYAIQESLDRIDQAIKDFAFRGVHVLTEGGDVPLDDKRMYPLYGKCAQLGIPVVIQVGVSMASIAKPADLVPVARDFPELVVVAGICGSIDLSATLQVIEHFPNVYFAFDGLVPDPHDVSAFLHSPLAAERAMFGSNGLPWLDLIEGIARLEMPEDRLRAFLWENASRVFQIEAKGIVRLPAQNVAFAE